MSLTYEESAALMGNTQFKGRVKVACLHFAAYVNSEPTNTPAHTSRVRWAQNCVLNPDGTANQITPPAVMEPPVQAAGAAVTDANLQTAVETVINSFL